MFINKEDFYNTLTEKNSVLNHYEKLIDNFKNSNSAIFIEEDHLNVINKGVSSVRLFPSYLIPVFKKNESLKIKEIPQKNINGYAIVIKEKQDIEDFLRNEYSKSFRANIKRLTNRLETCFNVKYEMIYGEISKEKYLFFMNSLHKMLTTRFDERNDKNDILENWAFYLETTFDLINTQKASIYVIYNDDAPIHICVNHHFNNLFFVSIPSYDIDYAKFALGNISILKLLEWAIINDYNLLDMAYGDLEYKRRWSNLIYSFNHHIIYPKNIIISRLKAQFEISVISFKNFLKKYKVDILVKNLKRLKKGKANKKFPKYTIHDIVNFDTEDLLIVDLNSIIKYPIKKLIFEFLYTNKEHLSNITVYKTQSENEFFVIGKAINQQIILHTDHKSK